MTSTSQAKGLGVNKKISGDELKSFPHLYYSFDEEIQNKPTLYNYSDNGYQYDLLWYPKKSADKMFVLFSGDALRKKNNPPVFQRWSWANLFPGHCVYISDPMLHTDSQLSLSWYSGSRTYDPLAVIADLIVSFAEKNNIKKENIVLYGSSGGGFAALKLAQYIEKATIIVINPQTDILKYEYKVEYFLDTCYPGLTRDNAAEELPTKFNVINGAKSYANRKLIYMQNRKDSHHYHEHYKPFLEMMNSLPEGERKEFHTYIFKMEGGHAAAESDEAFEFAMDLIK